MLLATAAASHPGDRDHQGGDRSDARTGEPRVDAELAGSEIGAVGLGRVERVLLRRVRLGRRVGVARGGGRRVRRLRGGHRTGALRRSRDRGLGGRRGGLRRRRLGGRRGRSRSRVDHALLREGEVAVTREDTFTGRQQVAVLDHGRALLGDGNGDAVRTAGVGRATEVSDDARSVHGLADVRGDVRRCGPDVDLHVGSGSTIDAVRVAGAAAGLQEVVRGSRCCHGESHTDETEGDGQGGCALHALAGGAEHEFLQ